MSYSFPTIEEAEVFRDYMINNRSGKDTRDGMAYSTGYYVKMYEPFYGPDAPQDRGVSYGVIEKCKYKNSDLEIENGFVWRENNDFLRVLE